MITITSKSTYFKESLFTFFKNLLHINCVINFLFSIGKQPYRYAYELSLSCSKHKTLSGVCLLGGGARLP